MRWGILILVALWPGVSPPTVRAQAADPLEQLKSFSEFPRVDVDRLLAGNILAERGSLMNFPNGISVQTCFAVPTAPEETARRLQSWDPSPHRELKVFAFRPLHNPVEPADFDALDLKSRQYPIRWLHDKLAATTADRSDLNLSRSEAQALAGCLPKNDDPGKIAGCLARLLADRAAAFQARGYNSAAPYELSREQVAPAVQLRSMLREQQPIAREFAGILQASGLLGGHAATLTPFGYWSLFDADHKGTVSLGAVYLQALGERFQVLDTEYYVTGNYYASATLCEIWPIRRGETSGSLVWRGDFFAAPALGITKGTERIAYGAIMLQDIKLEIRCQQGDLKGPR